MAAILGDQRITVGVGPELPGIGSWEWVGQDFIAELEPHYDVVTWYERPPACDVLIVVKYRFAAELIADARDAGIIYCPIDAFGSSAEIDRHGVLLARCQRIIIHAEPLRKYFQSYAPVEYVDHALRYVAPIFDLRRTEGEILWVGMRSNLPPLVEWINRNPLPAALRVLTDLKAGESPSPTAFGFGSHVDVRIDRWTAERHVECTARARAAIDIKGTDFRQRHKPPAKALDFIASGLPLAMNRDSSSAMHLARMGFQVCAPVDRQTWFSEDYWQATRRFGLMLRERLSRPMIGQKLRSIVDQVLQERRPVTSSPKVPCRAPQPVVQANRPTRIAVLSFLFNWPSTGGGIIHTVELIQFLQRAGYEVRHFFARFRPWGIGGIGAMCPVTGTAIEFDERSWHPAEIRRCFRQAVDAFEPDHVLITDCWNFKPHLAHAMQGYSYFLRMQAQELLCPLNNLRLLPGALGGFQQCPTHQLAEPHICHECLRIREPTSGGLHRLDRALSGVGRREYDGLLRQSLKNATAVLVLNPAVAELLRPWCSRVEVVTWGMDPERFPWPRPHAGVTQLPDRNGRVRILFAGLIEEPIKGFHVIREACRLLWQHRQDFELIVTHHEPGQLDDFTRSVGWKSQAELPDLYASCDICAVPTIAQDGLSRTSVEAMACGIPVIGSRIGGLPHTVQDGITGLLCEPGDVSDWARKLSALLNDSAARQAMGGAGRKVFEERFQWPDVIARDYKRLFGDEEKPDLSATFYSSTDAKRVH